MKVQCAILVFLTMLIMVYSNTVDKDSASNSRDSRFLSIFTVVQFPNQPCNNSAGNGGVCTTSAECGSRGGSWDTSCANGFGVCCVEVVTCGGTIDRNCTYFRNPGYSSTTNEAMTCALTIRKCNDDICAYRYDFEDFELHDPNTETVCDVDSFVSIGGSYGESDTICGYNTGQHMYYDVGPNTNEVQLNMLLGVDTTENRKWSIKISQIPCCSKTRPPPGCTQYFTENTGIIKSYNLKPTYTDSVHLAQQNQRICFRQNEGMCNIQYFNYPASTTAVSNSLGIFGDADNRVVPVACVNDFILIPNGVDVNSHRADRFCGVDYINLDDEGTIATISSAVPLQSSTFQILFKTNGNENAAEETLGTASRGFIMEYAQVPC